MGDHDQDGLASCPLSGRGNRRTVSLFLLVQMVERIQAREGWTGPIANRLVTCWKHLTGEGERESKASQLGSKGRETERPAPRTAQRKLGCLLLPRLFSPPIRPASHSDVVFPALGLQRASREQVWEGHRADPKSSDAFIGFVGQFLGGRKIGTARPVTSFFLWRPFLEAISHGLPGFGR